MENYTFPNITHISEIKEHISGKEEFIIIEKDNYDIIDYVFQKEDTFSNFFTRECRGIMFDKKGFVIARKFHKFFNVNEIDDVCINVLDFTNCYILDKLDGSMIASYSVDGQIEYGTKKGKTEISVNAEKFIEDKPNYRLFSKVMACQGYTPIFEWLDPKNPIVIKYDNPALILTAVRNNSTGLYKTYDELVNLSLRFEIPLVEKFDFANKTPEEIVDYVRSMEGSEGVVVRNDKTGHMVKIKASDYVQIHKIKEQIVHDHHIMRCILDNKIDDIIGILPEYNIAGFKSDVHELNERLTKYLKFLEEKRIQYVVSGVDRKEFSISTPDMDDFTKSFIFKMYNGQKIDLEVIKQALKIDNSDKKLKQFVALLKNDFDK